jgi:hypothetical protein
MSEPDGDEFERIAVVMERALAGIVADLQCQEQTAAQRLADIRRRIVLMQKLENQAGQTRARAARERWRGGL